MKKCIFLLVSFSLVLSWVNAQNKEPGKHALIIAIGDYPTETTGWPRISSTNDIALVKSALLYQKFDDIVVIQDDQATKEGILNAIKQLESKLKAGDVAVIHLSCHGQQIQDYNFDEIDGYDEAIIPYDAPVDMQHVSNIDFKGIYTNQNHLIDDEFGIQMDNLRTKLGPNGDLVVFIDACHSGTGTRGEAKVRGGYPPFINGDFKPTNLNDNNEVFLFQNGSNPKMSNYVVFSAARAEELNFELKEGSTFYGPLSWAYSKALKECSEGITYRGLFSKIQSFMLEKAPKQNPTIEGGIDRKLFGGKAVAQQPYLTIEELNKTGTSIIINGGKVAGIYDSTKVALYKAGTVDIKGALPIATGYVTEADNLTSTVVFPYKLSLKNKNEAWVFILEKTFPDVRLNVSLGSFTDKNLKKYIENYLNTNKIANLANKPNSELIIEQSKLRGASLLAIHYTRDYSSYLDSLKKDTLDQVFLAYIQAKFIRELDIPNTDYNIDLTFIPVKKYKDSKKIDTLKIENFIVNGTIEFQVGVTFLVKIKNTGIRTCYFQILDIQPDGIINAIAPSIDGKYYKSPEYFKLEPGKSMYLPYNLIVSPPYGKELYKVFASEKSIDLSFIVNSRGAERKGSEMTPLEKIFKWTYNKETNINKRGSPPDEIQMGSFGTTDIPFIIKPK